MSYDVLFILTFLEASWMATDHDVSWAGDDDGDDGSDDRSHLVSWAGSRCMSFSQAFPAEKVALGNGHST